jgi:hypothetical protein
LLPTALVRELFHSGSFLDRFWMVSRSLIKLLWMRAVPINGSYRCICCRHAKSIQF